MRHSQVRLIQQQMAFFVAAVTSLMTTVATVEACQSCLGALRLVMSRNDALMVLLPALTGAVLSSINWVVTLRLYKR